MHKTQIRGCVLVPRTQLHRAPNNAQNTQHKLGVAFSYLERNYTPTKRQQEIPNSMFRTPVDGIFADFLRAPNMVRVIESKII